MKYFCEHTVRSYECDSYGHANNAVYLNWLEYARMEFLHQIDFAYKDLVAEGFFLYISHIDIYYKASAFLDDKLIIDVEVVDKKTVSGTFKQTVKKADGTICAQATVKWASVNKDGKPCKIPEKFLVKGLFPKESGQKNLK